MKIKNKNKDSEILNPIDLEARFNCRLSSVEQSASEWEAETVFSFDDYMEHAESLDEILQEAEDARKSCPHLNVAAIQNRALGIRRRISKLVGGGE